MFTGIVGDVGRITSVRKHGSDRRIVVACQGDYLEGLARGDSVAVAGVCLTAVALGRRSFAADVSAETLALTTAGAWRAGTEVNLERALTPTTPLGGHLMSGHVDGVGELVARRREARSWRLSFSVPARLARYIARKGSIAVDGVSLTVNEVAGRRFGVNIIPQTWEHTTLGRLEPGAKVNLEVDLIARYLERLFQARGQKR
ncbi:MAG: riboflavin synthase [Nevskia sp.]|nr:riboflavin synthase [Nevskia sp.]